MTDVLNDTATKVLFPTLSSNPSSDGGIFFPLVQIRAASPDDLDWLVQQSKEFSKFNGTVYPMFDDEQHVRDGLLALMTSHFMRLAVRGDERLGFITGYYIRHPFNPQLITLCEIMWWVAESHRRSRAGIMLLDAYIAWGKENANWITFSLQSHSPVKEETLTKRGFQLHELSFLMEVL